MQSYLKTRPVWIQLLLFLGMAFGIFLVFSFLGMAVLSKMTGIGMAEMSNMENWDYSQPRMLLFMRGMLLMQFLGLFLIPSLLFAYFSDPHPAQYIGLKKPSKNIYWLLGLVALLVAIPLIDYIGMLNQKMHFGGAEKWMQEMEKSAAKQTAALLAGKSINTLIINLIFIAAFAGIGEELFFRGVLQRLFIRSFKNAWAGIIVAAFLFSFFHFQFFGFFPRFLLGILLGALYWYSGSLWTSIIAHFVYDGFIVFMLYLKPELAQEADSSMFASNNGLPLLAIISAALVAAVFIMLKKNSTTSYAAIYSGDTMDERQKFTFDD